MSPPNTPERRTFYQVGDIVTYRPLEGRPYTSIGSIVDIVEHPTTDRYQPMSKRGKMTAELSKENPAFLIHNELTGKTTLVRHTAVVERNFPPTAESK
ncbi:hypothetical protein O0I10_008643 [Lichtheimia ornata]|uniref:Hypervirulence associated protein TUDOR domain-containing protein n=1 Tax=Lichtheimia ornata TaxID=688661 RepID=A0AAD7V028_9FUNG|nr:uncharacterized protein O0I10_008643 [Lichtheimia ornata]KAJ8655757.1 hypothetical protein O0I10_008643 [Lichtheimia ornata]